MCIEIGGELAFSIQTSAVAVWLEPRHSSKYLYLMNFVYVYGLTKCEEWHYRYVDRLGVWPRHSSLPFWHGLSGFNAVECQH